MDESKTTPQVSAPLQTRLYVLNLVAAIVHALFFIVPLCLVLGDQTAVENSMLSSASYRITRKYRKSEDSERLTQYGQEVSEVVQDWSFFIFGLLLLFPFLTAVAHALNCVFKKQYYSDLAGGTNYRRWLEYSFTATIMIVLVSLSLGMQEFSSLFLVATATAVVMVLGYFIEQINATEDKSNLAGKLLTTAWFLYACVIGVVFWTFYEAIAEVEAEGSKSNRFEEIKPLIYGSGITILVFFTAFGFVQTWQVWSKRREKGATEANAMGQDSTDAFRKRAVNFETTYLALSLASKTILASFVLSGIFGRQEEDAE